MTDTNTPTRWAVADKGESVADNWHPIVELYEGCPSWGSRIAWALAGDGEGPSHDRARANAERIVRAVNAHDDLVSKARAVVASSHKFQDGQHDTKPGCVNVDEAAVVALNELLIALAKAKAVQS